jgi:hypothetical protein
MLQIRFHSGIGRMVAIATQVAVVSADVTITTVSRRELENSLGS